MINLIVGVRTALNKTTGTNTNQNQDTLMRREIAFNVIKNTRLVSEGNQFFVQDSAKINIENIS
jgi:hypothetical protein